MADTETFFNAVRSDDIACARKSLSSNPELAKARWPGRAGDGKMRSLGPSPFNQHAWLTVPAGHAPDDPRYTSTPLIYSRNDEIVHLLVDAGADVNAKGTSGEIEIPDWFFTPLWRAAHDGRMNSIRLLVERGADVNYINPDGSNQALKTAAENDALEACDYLIAKGAKPDLITAAMLGMVDEVRAILAKNPESIQARDSHGRSALDAATLLDSFRRSRKWLGNGHDRAAYMLIEHGAMVELEHAASLGMIDEVRRIVAHDPEILRRPKVLQALLGGTATKESPLRAAKRRGHEEIISYLIQHGATESPEVIIQ